MCILHILKILLQDYSCKAILRENNILFYYFSCVLNHYNQHIVQNLPVTAQLDGLKG